MGSEIIVLYLLFMHWVADFCFQSNWMAQNKSSKLDALSCHVLIYSLILSIAIVPIVSDINLVFYFFFYMVGTHFLIDYVTSRITKVLWEKRSVHNFFVVIGFDQFLHQVVIILAVYYYGVI